MVAGGVEFLGALASAHGEFDDKKDLTMTTDEVARIQSTAGVYAQEAVRYNQAAQVLLPLVAPASSAQAANKPQ